MIDVVISLIPCMIASILIYGFNPLFNVMLATVGSTAGESIYSLMRKRRNTIEDWSAIVTGVILGLNLPPAIPFYMPVIGGIFATLIVKMLFGGIGRNFANPAITARIFLLLAWGASMTAYVAPIDLSKGFSEMFRYVGLSTSEIADLTSATPLSYLKDGNYGAVSNLDLFLGRIGGSAGEVCAIAVLIGFVYLYVRRIIDAKIPVIFVATAAICALAFYGDVNMILPTVLSGGLLFGAVFMATDYATSPNTPWGVVIYAVGCGFLTVLFRKFGRMPAMLTGSGTTGIFNSRVNPFGAGWGNMTGGWKFVGTLATARHNNMINYKSPTFNGVTFHAQTSFGDDYTNKTTGKTGEEGSSKVNHYSALGVTVQGDKYFLAAGVDYLKMGSVQGAVTDDSIKAIIGGHCCCEK